MRKASPMTTKVVVASFVAIIKQCRYHNPTGYKTIVFKFIAQGKQLLKIKLQILETAGPLGRPLEYATGVNKSI